LSSFACCNLLLFEFLGILYLLVFELLFPLLFLPLELSCSHFFIFFLFPPCLHLPAVEHLSPFLDGGLLSLLLLFTVSLILELLLLLLVALFLDLRLMSGLFIGLLLHIFFILGLDSIHLDLKINHLFNFFLLFLLDFPNGFHFLLEHARLIGTRVRDTS